MTDQQLTYPGDPYLVEGYSQSAAIAVLEKTQLMDAGQHPDVTFLLLGDLNRPNGGLDERFDGLYAPGAGLAFNGAEPTDAGIPTSASVRSHAAHTVPDSAQTEATQADADLAPELIASGVTTQPVETVIAVLAASRGGASINAAANASGINYRTAQRTVAAAAEHQQRQLLAVG